MLRGMILLAIVVLISLWVFLGIKCAKNVSKKIKEVFIKLIGGRPVG